MLINITTPPRLILYSQSRGLLLQYWASLNALGVYDAKPCFTRASLMERPPSADRYDLLLYDHLGCQECLCDILPSLAQRKLARQIIVLTHIDSAARERLLIWGLYKGVALLDVVNPPMDSGSLLGLLEKWSDGQHLVNPFD